MLSLLCLNILLKKDVRNSLLRIAEDILMDDSEPTEMGKMFFFSFLMCLSSVSVCCNQALIYHCRQELLS